MSYSSYDDTPIGVYVVALILTVGVLIFGIWMTALGYSNRHQQVITVQDKIVKTDSSKGKYLVFTDRGVYQNTDAFWIGKFNSSDVYSGLKVGEKYECDVMGQRIHFFSRYPNINSCTEVN